MYAQKNRYVQQGSEVLLIPIFYVAKYPVYTKIVAATSAAYSTCENMKKSYFAFW